jgi:hypothetical protein
MSDRTLTDGSPVPEDGSHRTIRADGQQVGYVVLSAEERAKGFVKPVRNSYVHTTAQSGFHGCGVVTRMGNAIAETYARNPRFYSGTFCAGCGAHFPLNQFHWDDDGEPMDPSLQDAWHAGKTERDKAEQETRRAARIAHLKCARDAIDQELKALGIE